MIRQHGFALMVALFWLWMLSGLTAETDDLKAYKRGTFLQSWLLLVIFLALDRLYHLFAA